MSNTIQLPGAAHTSQDLHAELTRLFGHRNFIGSQEEVIAQVMGLRNLKPVMRMVLYQLGLLELVQTLIFYPLVSLDPNFHGDWDSIYSFKAPIASTLTLIVHIISLAVFFYVLSRQRPQAVARTQS